MKFKGACLVLGVVFCALMACSPVEQRSADDRRPRIMATTTIVGDLVRRVGGDSIHLTVFTPPYADPHDYVFRPADMVNVAEADLVFVNGGGLEGNLDRLLKGVTHPDRIISLIEGIPLRHFEGEPCHVHTEHCHDGSHDPHVWTDPNNVMIWVQSIATALSRAAPNAAHEFAERATAVKEELRELDAWIREQVDAIPPERRLLVTDHYAFGYFADRYGFEEAGVVIRSFDSVAQPSARNVVQLVNTLQGRGITAIFVGTTVNPRLAAQIARDYGLTLVPIYSGALSDADGPASDYFAYTRYNVSAIVEHLQ